MGKSTKFTGHPIFGQILQMIKRCQIHTTARKQGTDRYYEKFTTYKHLVTMLNLVFEGCTSIREVYNIGSGFVHFSNQHVYSSVTIIGDKMSGGIGKTDEFIPREKKLLEHII